MKGTAYKGPFFAVVTLGVVLIVGALLLYRVAPTQTYSFAHIDVADTEALRERGLGGRADIPSDYGMLFVFSQDGRYGFWMKDMQVPIDIIWLSDTGAITGILPNVATSTYPQAFYPSAPVRYVLETRAGNASAHGWQVGTQLSLPLH